MNNWKFTLLICILSAMVISSCGGKKVKQPELRTLTLHFKADSVINDQVLLPVDIIVTPYPVMKKIVQIGPEAWFGSQFRDTLFDDELYPLAISGGGERTKKIVLKDITKILVYADFEDAMNRDAQQLLLDCPNQDNQYEILIKDRTLALKNYTNEDAPYDTLTKDRNLKLKNYPNKDKQYKILIDDRTLELK